MQHSIWNELYRCTNPEEFICDEGLKNDIQKYIKNNDIPHILLTGKSGQGKTTLAKLLVNNIDCDYLYLNASDENSVDTVRDKIKTFASSATFKQLKIIILDEADGLSREALTALRNVMETYSKKTRFILTCNYLEKIIDPIQSRCTVYKLQPPSKGQVAERLVKILEEQKVKYNINDVATIVNHTYPDIRRAINLLQKSSLDGELKITKTNLTLDYIQEILDILKSNDPKKWNNIRQVIANQEIRDFSDLYKALYEEYFENPNIVIMLAEMQYKQSFVVDKEISFMSLIAQIIKELNKKQLNG